MTPNTVFAPMEPMIDREKTVSSTPMVSICPAEFSASSFWVHKLPSMSLEQENADLRCEVARLQVLLAEYKLAVAKYISTDEGEIQEGVEGLKHCAKQGHTMATYYLAQAYFSGKGVPRDYAKSFQLFLQIMEKSPQACYMTGICYEEGKGVLPNTEYAFACYYKAAEQGNIEACFSVGLCFENGTGTKLNRIKAREFYAKAAESGNTRAMYNLALMYFSMTNKEDTAIQWVTKAAELGLASALFTLGTCHKTGENVPIDCEKAAKYFKLGSQQNHVACLNALANLYFRGEGVQRNIYKAILLYQQSARLGHSGAVASINLCMKILHLESTSVSNSSSSSSVI